MIVIGIGAGESAARIKKDAFQPHIERRIK